MRRDPLVCVASLLLGQLLWNAPAAAQELALTKACEAGFRRFIHMAQNGQLGDDVSNANVEVVKTQVRLELVRTGAPNALLVLTPKTSTAMISRYFDVVPGDGATASDVRRVERALDDAFREDPFQIPGLEESHTGEPIPSLAEAWTYGAWRGGLGVFERRMMALTGVRYTAAVIVALALGLLASVVLLWGATPRPGDA